MNPWFGPYECKWPVVPLREFASLGTGHTPSRDREEYWQDCTIPWVTVEDIRANGVDSLKPLLDTRQKISQLGLENSAAVVHPSRTVMLSRTASIGFSCVIGREMATTQAFVTWTPDKEKLDSAYLLAALRTMREHYFALAYGATHLTIYFPDIKTLRIPLPPLEEQSHIAKFLDYETAKIDALIEKQQQLIALLREKRQAVISHAVTKGLNPDAPMRDSGVEWLGEVQAHWKVHCLRYCAADGYKKFTDGDWVESPFITTEGVRLLQTGNVGIGEFREKGFRYISEDSFRRLNCTEIAPGDVLVCRLDGPVGRACLVPDLGVKMITSVDNAILKTSNDFDSRFLVYMMTSSQWIDWIENISRAGGGFRFRISRTMLGNQMIPAPPVEEQEAIADVLDEGRSRFEELIRKSEEAVALLQERRTTLISAAVTGKIDVRGWKPPESKAETEVA